MALAADSRPQVLDESAKRVSEERERERERERGRKLMNTTLSPLITPLHCNRHRRNFFLSFG
jgi:hypothetical protein